MNTRLQNYEAQQRRGVERKRQLVDAMGGGCAVCGYAKNLAALDFHHLDPAAKRIALDLRSLSNRTWPEIEREAAACQLLCRNCHAELHHPHLTVRNG